VGYLQYEESERAIPSSSYWVHLIFSGSFPPYGLEEEEWDLLLLAFDESAILEVREPEGVSSALCSRHSRKVVGVYKAASRAKKKPLGESFQARNR
jgi:hypothetical protein